MSTNPSLSCYDLNDGVFIIVAYTSVKPARYLNCLWVAKTKTYPTVRQKFVSVSVFVMLASL